MNAQEAEDRNHFLALTKIASAANRRLLVLDGKVGTMPAPVAIVTDASRPLKNSVPGGLAGGGLQDGLSGVSVFGLDNETVLRPNPGQPYLSLQIMGGEMRSWRVATDGNQRHCRH